MSANSRVFLVQNTRWVDPKDGRLKPKFDFTPATQFGRIVELLEPTASPFDLPPVVKRLHVGLSDYTTQDYLLLVGSPVLIGLAVAIAADVTDGHVAMLQWSGAQRCYFPARAFQLFNRS